MRVALGSLGSDEETRPAAKPKKKKREQEGGRGEAAHGFVWFRARSGWRDDGEI